MKTSPMRLAALGLFVWFAVSPQLKARDGKVAMRNGPVMTAREAKALIANASTPKEHLKIARYFNQEAEQFEAEARDHEELVAAYRKNPAPWAAQPKTPAAFRTLEHCEFLARSSREMAKALREMAASHEEMAKDASK